MTKFPRDSPIAKVLNAQIALVFPLSFPRPPDAVIPNAPGPQPEGPVCTNGRQRHVMTINRKAIVRDATAINRFDKIA